MRISISLWTINNWLRFTGFRVFVAATEADDPDDVEHRVGLMWCGSPFNEGEPKESRPRDREPDRPWGECEIQCEKCQSLETDTFPVEGRGWVLECGDCGHKEHLTGD